uniref:Anaphase-promoting complex subunit 11 RING-H2 finger domain-containing protein n=1 Tax=Anopheles gambiae TaxID=7165 RepID=A0A903XX06_ANOGA
MALHVSLIDFLSVIPRLYPNDPDYFCSLCLLSTSSLCPECQHTHSTHSCPIGGLCDTHRFHIHCLFNLYVMLNMP